MKMTDLIQEIRDITDGFITRGVALHPDWVTNEVMSNHPDITGEDADFYTVTSRDTVREQVRRQINRFKVSADSKADKQIIIEGFEKLQIAYLIQAGDQQVAIPLKKMSSRQRKEKAQEFRAMGAGCYLHADELERYDAAYPNNSEESLAA